MTTSTKVNRFTILKTKNQFILLCWKKKIMAYVHQLLDQPSQWQTSQQASPGSVPKFTSTSITVKQLMIKNKNINQSKSSLLIWHYVSYLFLFTLGDNIIFRFEFQSAGQCTTFYVWYYQHLRDLSYQAHFWWNCSLFTELYPLLQIGTFCTDIWSTV